MRLICRSFAALTGLLPKRVLADLYRIVQRESEPSQRTVPHQGPDVRRCGGQIFVGGHSPCVAEPGGAVR